MKYIFALLVYIIGINPLYAQKQNNQWRFGTAGAINFNTVPPSFVSGCAISTPEGSASVADKTTGALLFYTDGVTVWDANNQVMPNGVGLLGGRPIQLSSTTAAVIVPKPGSSSLYYIVTIDEQSSNNGLRYSLVDMTLNGGLGDVVSTEKNILIFQTSVERLEVVPASDGLSYWIVTHDGTNSFYAFKLNSAGVQPTPVVSANIGSIQGNAAGHLKVNRQFNKLAMGNFPLGSGVSISVELFDFNNTTGVVSNPITIKYKFGIEQIYGLEFSPNGKLLYVTGLLSRLIQYDITKPTALAIENSAYQVTTGLVTSLQLGPDDKIYVNAGGIDAITCANNAGASCNYQTNVIANQNGGGGYGLPKWVYFANDAPTPTSNSITLSDTCLQSATQFSIKNKSGVVGVSWNFGDPNSGTNNTANGLSVNHTFSQAGNYNIQAFVSTACGTDTLSINSLSIINCNAVALTGIKIGGDTCTTFTLNLQAVGTSNSPYFFWRFGDTASGVNDTITITGASTSPFPTHTFSAPGVYNVCVSYQEPGFPVSTLCRQISVGLCCTGKIVVTDSCKQKSIPFTVNINSPISSISWNFGDPQSGANNTSTATSTTHVFATSATYNVKAQGTANCGTFLFNVKLNIVNCDTPKPCLATILSKDTCLENGTSFRLTSNSTINAITWNFDDAASGVNNSSTAVLPTHIFSDTGLYKVKAIVNLSCGTDTVQKTINIISCKKNTHVANCDINIPNAFSPNGDGRNELFFPRYTAGCVFAMYEMLIYNRWGQLIFHTTNINQKWDGKYNHKDCPIGTYYYIIRYKTHAQQSEMNKSGGIVLIR